MRWGDKVCPHCGGDLYADYADIALACLKCGYHEPAPRPARSAPGPSATQPSRPDLRPSEGAKAAPRVALVEVRTGTRSLIERVCAEHGCQVLSYSGRGEGATENAELLIVEADRGGVAVAMGRQLRAEAPAVPIAVVLTWWTEYEPEAQSTAEFVMHAPLREREMRRVLEIMESYGGWLPSPLLAATYRARTQEKQARVAN
jgi:hypothetical protein